MPAKKTIYRRSDNGQITTKKYADKHPRTTERQHVPPPKPKKFRASSAKLRTIQSIRRKISSRFS